MIRMPRFDGQVKPPPLTNLSLYATILSTRYTKRSLTKEERDYRMPEMNISNLTTREIIRELEIVYPASSLAKIAAERLRELEDEVRKMKKEIEYLEEKV